MRSILQMVLGIMPPAPIQRNLLQTLFCSVLVLYTAGSPTWAFGKVSKPKQQETKRLKAARPESTQTDFEEDPYFEENPYPTSRQDQADADSIYDDPYFRNAGCTNCDSMDCCSSPGCSTGVISCGSPVTCGSPVEFGCSTSNTLFKPWIRAEYLAWWVDGFFAPALITTSTNNTGLGVAGVLGEFGTAILFGNEDFTKDRRSGGRITAGFWFDACESNGIQASYFGLGSERTEFQRDRSSNQILARPFFNVRPGFEGQDAEYIAFPGVFEGEVSSFGLSRLEGGELLYRSARIRNGGYRLDFLAGYRFNRLEEELFLSDFRTVTSSDSGLAVGTTLGEFDRFSTTNTFHGLELGYISEHRGCDWSLEFAMKLALGNNRARATIDGGAVGTVPVAGGPVQVTEFDAGLLAQETNIGVYERDDFSVVPELGVTYGWKINSRWRATLGYTFMYWSRVARPGDQIDTNLNLSQLGGGGLEGIPRPEFSWKLTDVWAHGLSLGLEGHF